MNKQFLQSLLLLSSFSLFVSCDETTSTVTQPSVETGFVVGIEAATGTDILLTVDTITSGTISPVNQGIEQPAWMSFYAAGNMILASGYTSDNILTGYEFAGENTQLVATGQLVTDQGIFAATNVNDEEFLAVGTPREGFEDRVIYSIDKPSMSISERFLTKIDERKALDLVAFPTGILQRESKVYLSYYLMGSGAVVPAFATPLSDSARIAVYNYPSMEFDKYIKDDRTSDIGNYTSKTALQADENGDIYTFSTSSNATGFYPTPTKPSGFLRIKSGATAFDQDYFFNFEEKSGGMKINNAVYAGNGKMVVRTVTDDSQLWATYGPNTDTPICSITIADLNAQTVTKVTDVPLHGGEWGIAHLVKEGKVYLNISDSNGGYIYEIDPETATAKKGAKIDGHYAKGIFSLEKN
ncbi:DUF4374 domain-containing protein [Flammeovirga kamogawensis]|uniref:DUF4374 domain-containing protein n=1 Tax=Flammeovirga kamogawensis TaxID=373891 RepID=A0ABX8H204_9BACT|nr:DUF4374 domain-containing protein [Flammeovirga kamogawensis]MBB6463633.1 hypothetical protein [Flammeovirga kamogawensis]QWG09855.1 DUF4374 domain-containing protein [Flammeovirga kamogawensis]TRX65362.1 DUF4374 domain-containing protein [Flammeovirga kamogawensis]